LIVASCSDTETPTNPTGIVNVAGLWTGTYRIRSCTDTVAGMPGTFCAPLIAPSAPLQRVRLSLQQTDDRVVGNLELSGWIVRSVIVSGVVQEGGSVVLDGMTTWTDAACPTAQNRLTLTFWNSIVNRSQDAMTGDFKLTAVVRMNACVFAELSIDADTLELARQ
jgi:hypothetical protein